MKFTKGQRVKFNEVALYGGIFSEDVREDAAAFVLEVVDRPPNIPSTDPKMVCLKLAAWPAVFDSRAAKWTAGTVEENEDNLMLAEDVRTSEEEPNRFDIEL